MDLDERLKRNDKIWDLDRERLIFTKKRGYKWQKESEGRKQSEDSADKTGGDTN